MEVCAIRWQRETTNTCAINVHNMCFQGRTHAQDLDVHGGIHPSAADDVGFAHEEHLEGGGREGVLGSRRAAVSGCPLPSTPPELGKKLHDGPRTCGSHAPKRGLIGGGRRPPGSFMYSLGLKNFLVSLVVRHLRTGLAAGRSETNRALLEARRRRWRELPTAQPNRQEGRLAAAGDAP